MNFPHKVDDKRWLQHTRSLLRSLQRQSGYNRYTLPDASADAQQSPFLSALYALVYRWFDGDMAADELKSAVAQRGESGTDDGLIPGLQDWKGDDPTFYAAPPLLAFAAVAVYHLTGDSNLIERLYPIVAASHDWFDRRRVVDGLAIPAHPGETLRGALGFGDPNVAYEPTQEDILELNVLRAADLDAVAHLAKDMGKTDAVAGWEARAQAVRAAVSRESSAPLNPLLLFAEAVTPEQAAQIATTLQAADRLWTPDGESVVALLYNWLIYVGLRAYDQRPAANRLAELALERVEQAGDYALFDADTGAGIGDAGQPLAVLAVDMLFRERQSIPPGSHCI